MNKPEEENRILVETKPVTDPCGECMGAAFGDCDKCRCWQEEERTEDKND